MVIVNILAFRCGLVWFIIKRKTRIIIYMYLKKYMKIKKIVMMIIISISHETTTKYVLKLQ